ncbi:MAG: molybdopterin oxidoreductase [Firmicutes bacterium HGW-Firmicutes-16]|nr:MAG: molybdopterin oxidoreductase [Firmicutes bacterium HGW-Firmicutes-16]
MVKEIICIVCPNGCSLRTEKNDGEVTVTGNKCPKGEEYAKSELLCPQRTLTSTVATAFSEHPVLPVRITGAIPKGEIKIAMLEINKIIVDTKLKCGDVIVKNFMNLGVDLVATDDVDIY